MLVDLNDIESQVQVGLDKTIEVLRETLGEIRIAKTGYTFLFDRNRNLLIPPPTGREIDYRSVTNETTGNNLLDDFMEAAESGDLSISYTDSSGDTNQPMKAYVSYFKPLDWYIACVAPIHEIRQPADDLVARQSVMISFVFLGSLIAAFFFMSRISRPINMLASWAKELPFQDFTSDEEKDSGIENLRIRFKDEVARLAESFVVMKMQLRKNIQNLLAAESKYRTILQSIEEGFFETDLSGNMTFLNDAMSRMLGYSREDLMGTKYSEYTRWRPSRG